MTKIYCVEDDDNIRNLIVYALRSNGFQAIGFEDPQQFQTQMDKVLPDIILLDIMLPDKDGLTILREIRANIQTQYIPIIMITAKTSEYDRVIGLDTGADDYIVKPFSVMELISRVKAILRRTNINKSDSVLTLDGISLDYKKRLVLVDNTPIKLTYKEFELLYLLLKNRDLVLRSEERRVG